MTLQEQQRLRQHHVYVERGQIIIDLLVAYYEQEQLLYNDDIFERKSSTIRLKYLNRHFLLELRYNEEISCGQILVFESEQGTEFWSEPKFILKPISNIFYDSIGNVYIGSTRVAHMNPDNSAEDIIREIVK